MTGENENVGLGQDAVDGLKELLGGISPATGGGTPPVVPPVVPVTPPTTPPITEPTVPPIVEGGGNPPAESEEEFYENEGGDIVDSTGKVIIAKADVKYDADGNVLMPEADDKEVERIRKSLELELGVAFTDDNGQPISFENTDEGVVSLVKTAAVRMQEQFETDFFDAYPDAAELVRHLRTGKPKETFFNVPTQWRNTVIPVDTDKTKEVNKVLRKNVLMEKEVLARTGGNIANMTKEQVDLVKRESSDYVEYLMSTGTDVEKAQDALRYLQSWETQQEQGRNEENKAILRQQQEAAQAFWGNVRSTVESGNLNLVGIPKTERQAFYEYMSKPVDKDGNTQEQLDFAKEDIKNRVFLSYMRYKKFNVDEVLKSRLLNEKARQLEGTKHKKVSVKFGKQDGTPKANRGFDGININTITNS